MGEARRQFWERVFVAIIEGRSVPDATVEQIAEHADHAVSAWEQRWIASEPQPPQG